MLAAVFGSVGAALGASGAGAASFRTVILGACGTVAGGILGVAAEKGSYRLLDRNPQRGLLNALAFVGYALWPLASSIAVFALCAWAGGALSGALP
jgi:hypothetical protein